MRFPPSSHDYQGWLSQFARTHRWYKKIKSHQAETRSHGLSGEAEDCIYAFFQNCFHLREWIEKSKVISKPDIDSFISGHQELRICRDICNGTKHMVIDRPSVSADISTYREYDWLSVPSGQPEARGTTTFRILIGGAKYDMFDLADRCMDAWLQLLQERRLITKANESKPA